MRTPGKPVGVYTRPSNSEMKVLTGRVYPCPNVISLYTGEQSLPLAGLKYRVNINCIIKQN